MKFHAREETAEVTPRMWGTHARVVQKHESLLLAVLPNSENGKLR